MQIRDASYLLRGNGLVEKGPELGLGGTLWEAYAIVTELRRKKRPAEQALGLLCSLLLVALSSQSLWVEQASKARTFNAVVTTAGDDSILDSESIPSKDRFVGWRGRNRHRVAGGLP